MRTLALPVLPDRVVVRLDPGALRLLRRPAQGVRKFVYSWHLSHPPMFGSLLAALPAPRSRKTLAKGGVGSA
ncbi:hypothetical protein GCM10027590_03500 [Nocardiopsis nanhaiensis]